MMQADAPVVVSIEKEPRHRPVYREGYVRILDVQIPPGDVTLFHTHDTAILYVPISISPTDTQILGKEWLGVGPNDTSRFTGQVVATDTSYASRPLTHRVKNVGGRLFRLIAITNAATNPPPGALCPRRKKNVAVVPALARKTGASVRETRRYTNALPCADQGPTRSVPLRSWTACCWGGSASTSGAGRNRLSSA